MTVNLLFDALIRTSLVIALGLGVARWLRAQPSALRHWVLVVTIVFAAAQPALRLAVPEWRIAAASTVRAALPTSSTPDARATTEVMFASAFEPIPGVHQRDGVSVLVRAWLAGTILILWSMLAAVAWLWWQAWRGSNPDGAWLRERDAIAAAMGMRVRVRVRETRHPALLVTWGAVRPILLLPRGASAWPIDRVRLVLAHELAHVARRDWLVHIVAELARACYWPNPLFWIACARLRIESEQACDDCVLDLGNNRTSYASHLVELARSFRTHGRTWLPAPSMARPSTLERRVVAMLNVNLNRLPISRWRRLAIAVLLAGIAIPIAAATGRAGAPGGVLRDPSGRVLPGATVRLSAVGSDAIHETQSDSTGVFQFPEIPDGDYMLSARLPGFSSGRQRVRVSPSMSPLELTAQVGTLKETVTVKGGAGSDSPGRSVSARPKPSKPACGSTELGGNIKPPMKLNDVRPRYKNEWTAEGLSGNVLLQAVIGTDGKVRNVEVVSPVNADLEDEAINAVSQWEFSPTWLNCEPIEVRMFVTVAFSIER